MPIKTRGKRTYPETGTRAYDVLGYIRSNPGTTKNSIIVGLRMNPSVVKKCVAALLNNGRISDEMDENGHHHFTAREIL